MTRQSISFTAPNDAWQRAQVDSEEYISKSDVVNDLIRKAREIEYIRAKLIRAEQGGGQWHSLNKIGHSLSKTVLGGQ